MRSVHLFEIDPIVESICSELDQPQLYACALVSRQWYTSFTRHLWRTIRIRQQCKLVVMSKPHMHSILTKNGRYIHTIDTPFPELVQLLQPFLFGQAKLSQPTPPSTTSRAPLATPPPSNLTHLYCRSLSQAKLTHKINNTFLKSILTFAHNTPRLQVLEFEHFDFTDEYVFELAHLMHHHPRLRHVRIDCFQPIPLHMYLHLLWSASHHLESFELVGWPYDGYTGPMIADTDAVLNLLRIEKITPHHDPADAVKTPRGVITNRTFRIQALDLGQCHFAMVEDGDPILAALLRHCTRLTSLTLPYISSPFELRGLSIVIREALENLRHLDARALNGSDLMLSELVTACAGDIDLVKGGIQPVMWDGPGAGGIGGVGGLPMPRGRLRDDEDEEDDDVGA
ncbi:hypothetical protein EC968_009946 [Mortierella alpina]|nr:hypothetical protein EC968_009946 [Mortierella alpina]